MFGSSSQEVLKIGIFHIKTPLNIMNAIRIIITWVFLHFIRFFNIGTTKYFNILGSPNYLYLVTRVLVYNAKFKILWIDSCCIIRKLIWLLLHIHQAPPQFLFIIGNACFVGVSGPSCKTNSIKAFSIHASNFP